MWTKFQLCVPISPWEKGYDIFWHLKTRKKNKEIKGRISSRNLVLFHIKQQNLWFRTLVPNYKILCTIVPEKYLSQISLCITMEWEMEKRRQNKSVLFVPQYTWPLSMKTLALIEAKKFVTENLLGDKEKWTNKRNDKSSMLILFYTIQVILNICTKLGAVVPEKSLTQISLCITLEWEMEKMERECKNKCKNKSRHLGFLSHNILGHSQGV